MIAITKILVPTDLSDEAQEAAAKAFLASTGMPGPG